MISFLKKIKSRIFVSKSARRDGIIRKKLKEAISNFIGDTAPLYSFGYDMSCDNKRLYGLCAVTEKLFIKAQCLDVDDEISVSEFELSELCDAGFTENYGSVSLECTIDGEEIELCRATMKLSEGIMNGADAIRNIREKRKNAIPEDKHDRHCPKCGRRYLRNSTTCLHCGGAKKTISRLISLARPHIGALTLSVILFFGASALGVIVPYINRILIDDYIKAPNAAEISAFSLIIVIVALAISRLLVRVFNIARSLTLIKVSTKLIVKIRGMLFDKIQSLSLSAIQDKTAGDLITRITQDTRILNDFLTYQAPQIIQMGIMLVVTVTAMLIYDPILTVLVVVPCPFVMLFYRLVNRFMHKLYHRSWNVGAKANSIMHDIFGGIRVVKVFGMESYEQKKYEEVIARQRDLRKKEETLWNTITPAVHFFMGIGEYIVLLYAGTKILGLEMTLGELTQMTSYMSIIYEPLNYFSRIPRILIRSITSTAKIFEIIDEEIDVSDAENAVETEIEGNVEFKNVNFGYDSHKNVLEDISFTAKKGEMIGIVGHSGAGKSTLINLIMRLYDPDSGSILIDGRDIKEISQRSLRKNMGVVLQETYLFTGTVFDNIAYAKRDATRDEIIRAAKLSGAHKFIIKLPDAYNTVIGERGYTLSGGERQRIAIARAILGNPKILILDEATSALDTVTEKIIQDALKKLIENRTTFAIAHRLSTLRNATKLIVIDGGRIAEIGTHEELLKKKGIYYELVMAQRQMAKPEKE